MKTIALYPGSFNKFHVGHLNIFKKAESIFGINNVVIAIGVNQDKDSSVDITEKNKYAEYLSNRIGGTVLVYSCFMHELIEKYEKEGFNVVIIRGLRNTEDLEYEINQMKFVNNLKNDKVNVVYITCDAEFEHISSSSIRKIEKLGGVEMTRNLIV